jgi:hypothetical protein
MMSFYEQQEKMRALQSMNLAQSPVLMEPPTRRQHLERRQRELSAELDKIGKAIKILDEHPELEEFMDTLMAAGL